MAASARRRAHDAAGPSTAKEAPAAQAAVPEHLQRVLAMQRAAGNRATAQELQRWPSWMKKLFGSKKSDAKSKAPEKPAYPMTIDIGAEKVVVNSEAEAKDAARIIKECPEKYGIEVSSARSMKALKSRTGSAPEDLKKKIATWPWLYKELRAVEKALEHYAPVLGEKRKSSTRAGTDQEVVSVGKMEAKLKKVSGTWQFSESVIGEYFSESDLRAFTMYKHGETATPDYTDVDKQLEATAVHEMAHGILRSSYDRWAKELDYWLDQDTKSGTADAEAPPTRYGATNAREDLAESAMFYFVDPERLKKGNGAAAGTPGNACPKRYALMAELVGDWKPKVGDFPLPDPGATTAVV